MPGTTATAITTPTPTSESPRRSRGCSSPIPSPSGATSEGDHDDATGSGLAPDGPGSRPGGDTERVRGHDRQDAGPRKPGDPEHDHGPPPVPGLGPGQRPRQGRRPVAQYHGYRRRPAPELHPSRPGNPDHHGRERAADPPVPARMGDRPRDQSR